MKRNCSKKHAEISSQGGRREGTCSPVLFAAWKKGPISHSGCRKLRGIWCCEWRWGEEVEVNWKREVRSRKYRTSDGQPITVCTQPSSTAFPRCRVTHLSFQSLKFPGFFTHKLLFCRFSLGVVYFATLFQIKKYLSNGLPSTRALEQPLTSESTQFS